MSSERLGWIPRDRFKAVTRRRAAHRSETTAGPGLQLRRAAAAWPRPSRRERRLASRCISGQEAEKLARDEDAAADMLLAQMISPPASPFVLPSPLARSPASRRTTPSPLEEADESGEPDFEGFGDPSPPPAAMLSRVERREELQKLTRAICRRKALEKRISARFCELRRERGVKRREFALADGERGRAIERTKWRRLRLFVLGRQQDERHVALIHPEEGRFE